LESYVGDEATSSSVRPSVRQNTITTAHNVKLCEKWTLKT